MLGGIWCWLFHRSSVSRYPGYDEDEAQCLCGRCGRMWLENRPDLWKGPWRDQTNNHHKTARS